MFVGLTKEIHFSIGDAEASGQHAFNGNVTVVKSAPCHSKITIDKITDELAQSLDFDKFLCIQVIYVFEIRLFLLIENLEFGLVNLFQFSNG
jgi:hypothetical protein